MAYVRYWPKADITRCAGVAVPIVNSVMVITALVREETMLG
jgi:hypothetical protein